MGLKERDFDGAFCQSMQKVCSRHRGNVAKGVKVVVGAVDKQCREVGVVGEVAEAWVVVI